MARRTVRKLTCWTDEEWRRVADAARSTGKPPLRFVREAALEKAGGMPPKTPRKRRTTDELAHQFGRVLNNLRQLLRVAEEDFNDDAAALLEAFIEAADTALAAAPTNSDDAAAVLAVLLPVGIDLNEMAHRANGSGTLPPVKDVRAVLNGLYAALRPCLR
jgi:hypothetical protein